MTATWATEPGPTWCAPPDLGGFDARTRKYVAGSSAFGANELAESFVRKGQRLPVQACRYRGDGRRAQVSVTFEALPTRKGTARGSRRVGRAGGGPPGCTS